MFKVFNTRFLYSIKAVGATIILNNKLNNVARNIFKNTVGDITGDITKVDIILNSLA